MYQYAYLVGDAFLAIVWLTLFFLRKDLRKQQFFVSFLMAPFALLTQFLWFYQDYWRPEYIISFKVGTTPLGFEEPLFAFLIGGISAVLYEVIFKKRHKFGKPRNLAAIIILFSLIVVTTFLNKLGLNSIWAFSLTLLAASALMLTIDKDLTKDAVLSGILMTLLIIILYSVWFAIYPDAIQKLWVVKSLSGIKIGAIPIEEVIWFGSAGTMLGILYEFWLNVNRYTKLKKK